MFLKKLEIHGFKSFAKKTVLEFEPGIVSVVGPNGSGKSNLADALRWVFGEQSLKLLRGKKSEDVIFAGSDKKARLGGAAVQVFFDNTSHAIPIDYSEVVITRRLYRDQKVSEYLINGHLVRLLDVQELLAKSGFGNTSYHVIGQGLIDQLILGGPVAIKELIEEASGVKPYYTKRERTLRRLENTEANLQQVHALVKEIEPRLRSLRRQTRRLEQREDLEKDLVAAQGWYYGQLFQGLAGQIQEVSGKYEVFTKQIKELNEEIKKLSSDIAVQEQETLGRGKDYQKVQIDLEHLHQEKYKLQEQLAILRGRLKVEFSEEQNRQIDWQRLRDKFRAGFARLQHLIKNFRLDEAREVEKLFAEIAQLIEPAATGRGGGASRENLRTEEERLAKELAALFEEIKKLEADLAQYRQEEEAIKKQLFVKERLLRNKQETLVKTAEQKNSLAVEQARVLTRREAYEEEARANLGPDWRTLTSAKPGLAAPSGLPEKILNLKKQLAMIGGVDDLTLTEYREVEERYQYLTSQSADLEKGIVDLRTVIEELDVVIKKEFHEAFTKISEKFSEYFRMLLGGGRAAMTILREQPQEGISLNEDEIAEQPRKKTLAEKLAGKSEITGIDIRATPPGKKLAGIAALSGGERALTSIAFLCAMLESYPSPFVVLDEVDAALDEANSIRFGKILGSLAAKTQFITITHNRETMRQSHTLYGVTMGEDGISKVLSLKLEQAAVFSTKN